MRGEKADATCKVVGVAVPTTISVRHLRSACFDCDRHPVYERLFPGAKFCGGAHVSQHLLRIYCGDNACFGFLFVPVHHGTFGGSDLMEEGEAERYALVGERGSGSHNLQGRDANFLADCDGVLAAVGPAF